MDSHISTKKNSANATKRGKQPKHFLDKNEALGLAVSIANVQEKNAMIKIEKHQSQAGQPDEHRQPRMSASRVKLKETKALLAAQKAWTKKEKAKLRKRGSQEGPSSGASVDDFPNPKPKKPRKSVSFA